MNQRRKTRRKLRSGFTTGTAAAAAARAAAIVLLGTEAPKTVNIRLLNGEVWQIPVQECRKSSDEASCTVIKDAGDDPDVTNQAVIGVRARLSHETAGVQITGGQGVGRVTKPGLEVPPGEAAINPGPCRMIREAVHAAMAEAGRTGGMHVEVFVPKGREISARTLNHRLGIVGGISILGTTGVVRPLSHEAYKATIESAFSVAAACSAKTVVCTTGRRSERHAQQMFADLPAEAFVQIGDYFAESMNQAGDRGFDRVILAVFFGKAVKMAQAAPHTHAARARLALEQLAKWTRAAGADDALVKPISAANTAREAFFMLEKQCPVMFSDVAARVVQSAENFSGNRIAARAVLFDYSGGVAADTGAKEALR
ncbi:MAG: cobalt-precorrin-5B (C(1))-methyltransferase CbiD [Desulfobacteraceae bacterium]|nr:cobalt-precorrin-5B (C(1))-methyltransferase CbiD [Desulfobacteraceae bacterium]